MHERLAVVSEDCLNFWGAAIGWAVWHTMCKVGHALLTKHAHVARTMSKHCHEQAFHVALDVVCW